MRALPDRLVALLFALAVAVALPAVACAQAAPTAASEPAKEAPALTGLASALAHFLEDDFAETDAGITEVAASGDPRSATIIEALQDGRLSYSAQQKKVFFKDSSGKLFDALTGAAAGAEPADLSDVQISNRVRRSIDAALGGLRLQARDPDRRYEAAQAVFKSREQSALAALDAALTKETDPRVKQALTEARAAVILYSDDASEVDKLSAVNVIRARGDQDALNALGGLPAIRPLPSSAPPRTRSPRSRMGSRSGPRCKTSGTGCRSARYCCSPRSDLPSPSA